MQIRICRTNDLVASAVISDWVQASRSYDTSNSCRELPCVDWTPSILRRCKGRQNESGRVWTMCNLLNVCQAVWKRRCRNHIVVVAYNSNRCLSAEMVKVRKCCKHFKGYYFRKRCGHKTEDSAWLRCTSLGLRYLRWTWPCCSVCIYDFVAYYRAPGAGWRWLIESVNIGNRISNK